MDVLEGLQGAVSDAVANQSTLTIAGTGSKTPWLGHSSGGQMLSLTDYAGTIQYQPAELVVTARSGTLLKDLTLELAQNNQEIAADPPLLQGGGTVGGAVAAGFSGPGRPWLGSLRDAVLGVKVLNGRGEVLSFGGQVMKNVAGYDVSRLMSGSMGSLGVILEASVRVRPKSSSEITLLFDVDAQAGIDLCRSLARQPLPLSGTYWCANKLYVRLSGSEAGLTAAVLKVGGERTEVGDLWRLVRDHQLDFFKASSPNHAAETTTPLKLFSIVTPPAAPVGDIDPSQLAIEWAGGRRWVWHVDADTVHAYARSVGGWAWQVGRSVGLSKSEKAVMGRLKTAFDPAGIFLSPTQIERNDAD